MTARIAKDITKELFHIFVIKILVPLPFYLIVCFYDNANFKWNHPNLNLAIAKTLNLVISPNSVVRKFSAKTGLRNVVKLTGKHLLKSHFNIVAHSRPVTALKRESETVDSITVLRIFSKFLFCRTSTEILVNKWKRIYGCCNIQEGALCDNS